jgi:cyclic beta-1,2-glucan synthetase
MRVVLDGASLECGDERVRVPLDGGSHKLLISLSLGMSEDVNAGEQVV